MINSKKLLRKPSIAVPKPLVTLLIALAVIGFGISIYLTVEHLRGELPSCSVLKGCESVLTSKYAAIGPIPTASFGVAYYLVIILLGIIYLDTANTTIMKLIGGLTVIGFLESLYLVYLQIWVIGAICLYCMSSALVCTLLFLITLFVWRKYMCTQNKKETITTNEVTQG